MTTPTDTTIAAHTAMITITYHDQAALRRAALAAEAAANEVLARDAAARKRLEKLRKAQP